MKILTTNFLTCAVRPCKSSSKSYPLHFRDAVLERTETDFNPLFMRNILPRLDWDALSTTATELGVDSALPGRNPLDAEEGGVREEEGGGDMDVDVNVNEKTGAQREGEGVESGKEVDEEVLKKLHALLIETSVMEGKLVCGNCGFEYPIKEGVANFLLPSHLV